VGRIRVLDDETIAKISAGEVIERPASVVKELLENAIDAGAKRIEVELKDAGKALIRVTDDGCGMTSDEARLSVQRHTTSKIASADELFSIKTLGFRGEALPSIAAVSKLEMLTKPKSGNGLSGTRLRIEGGRLKDVSETGCPEGTTINAHDIFFSTPARLKYLKSNSTELSHISEIVSKYVLAYPDISFLLVHNGEKLIFSGGGGSLKDAFISVYGLEMASSAVLIDHSSGYVDVKGFVVRPSITRMDKSYQSFFVNGRAIRNFLLSRALADGFGQLIPAGRNPIAVLFIDIDPGEVDVNVHPAKSEVRFLKTNEVLSAVREAVSQALGVKAGTQKTFAGALEQVPPMTAGEPFKAEAFFDDLFSMEQGPSQASEFSAQKLFPVCQVGATYIVALDHNGIVLVDQHAAHERITYEELKKKGSGVRGKGLGVEKQNLLVAENIELNQSDKLILKENMEVLRDAGFDVDEFSGNSFMVRAVPAQLCNAPIKETLCDIISGIKDFGKSTSLEEKKDAVLKLIACHGSIRAGDALSREEMSVLLKSLEAVDNSSTCPHGRPTQIRISLEDLKKLFKRT
jgi:DNA mismatch repair protein MutL